MNKIKKLRSVLKKRKLDAFIIPTQDAHHSEYISPRDARRAFLTGFTGSAGTAIVTLSKAAIWVDGRYWLAAERQLNQSIWEIIKYGQKDAPTIPAWLNEQLSPKSLVGIDPFLTSVTQKKQWESALKEIRLASVETNPIDEIWEDQPAMPANPIYLHPLQYAGKSSTEKLAQLRETLKKKNCFALVMTALDEIAWLLNLRGSDIDFNPVFLAYCLVTLKDVFLFVQEGKLTEDAKLYLKQNHVAIEPYEEIVKRAKQIGGSSSKDNNVLLSPDICNLAIHAVLHSEFVKEEASPVEEQKAIKNPVEIQGMRDSHVRDGAAKTAWLAWLEEAVREGKELSEISAADKLKEYRRKEALFKGLSFDAISAMGSNAAVIHYKPTPESDTKIDSSKVYLIDSGAQYLDGTTDVTRTLHFGAPSRAEQKFFTLVLKGHIALARAVFPAGLSGSLLDALARQPLWRAGESYAHGTGHGVGSFLNVHEGPQFIHGGKTLSAGLEEGMLVSNEPGYYLEDSFGIRIESVVLAKASEHKGYLEFETVTMVPIQKGLIDASMLTRDEIEWLDGYHRRVLESLAPRLRGVDERAMLYLEKACAPLGV